MPRPIVTLTTDFGATGSYVAQMKGVLLGINADIHIVDVTHDIAPQNIRQGAVALSEIAACFPAGTIHIAVVDPGVGTKRKLVYARLGGRHFLAPDNGFLSLVESQFPATQIIELTNAAYWRTPVSATFHGRDILAPIAAHLSLGIKPELLGPSLPELTRIDWPVPKNEGQRCTGEVVAIDAFGNLITNLSHNDLALDDTHSAAHAEVLIGGHVIVGISKAYAEREIDSLIALMGSGGYLEVAVTNGCAARQIAAQVGDAVLVRWPDVSR